VTRDVGKLRVLYTTEYYDPSFLSDWVEIPRGLSKRGHEVTVLSPSVSRDDRRKKPRDYYENDNLRVIHRNFLGFQSPFSEAVLRIYPPFVMETFDIIHSNNLFVGSNFPLLLGRLTRRYSRAIINTEIESRSVVRSVERFAPWLHILDRVFVNSFHCASETGRHSLLSFGIRSEKIWVIPQGVDFGSFQRVRRRSTEEGVTIGFFGRITPQKGLDRVVWVLKKLLEEHRNVSILIGGPIPEKYEQYARRFLGNFKAEERFKYIGYVPDVRSFLDEIDIFLLPTREEATAKTPLEVMAGGRPVVASDIMPLTDYIEQGKSGFLARSEEEFYRYLKLLCTDGDFRARMGEAARERASMHDWHLVLDRIESMYESRMSDRQEVPAV
jgi:glycosyltransferase involved in cell wall biosynthesis